MEFHIQWKERLPSTNTFLKELAAQNRQVPSGTVVAAREQTAGRGRMDRRWLSAAGENLMFSLFFADDVDVNQWPSSSMAAAIAVAELLRREGVEASLKWPNDVLVNGRKICGILSERIPRGLIIGIGLNVNMQNAHHIDQPATSMRMETGRQTDPEELLPRLLGHLSVRLEQWRQGGFSNIRKEWESYVPTLGKTVTVRDGRVRRSGILSGFGEHGELLLRDENGTVDVIWAGDLSA